MQFKYMHFKKIRGNMAPCSLLPHSVLPFVPARDQDTGIQSEKKRKKFPAKIHVFTYISVKVVCCQGASTRPAIKVFRITLLLLGLLFTFPGLNLDSNYVIFYFYRFYIRFPIQQHIIQNRYKYLLIVHCIFMVRLNFKSKLQI